jgi:DNA-binding transcriptional ArsR family regulator
MATLTWWPPETQCTVCAVRPAKRSAMPLARSHVVSVCLRFVTAYRTEGLAALADPTRRTIFERLADEPRAVGELARELPVSRPAVSQHLRVLKDAGLVVDRPAGTRRIYQLDPDGVGALRAYLDQFWNRALAAYKAAVEQSSEEVA